MSRHRWSAKWKGSKDYDELGQSPSGESLTVGEIGNEKIWRHGLHIFPFPSTKCILDSHVSFQAVFLVWAVQSKHSRCRPRFPQGQRGYRHKQ